MTGDDDLRFLRIELDEVARFGDANAALVLALIRYRCNIAAHDRVEDEDGRWWRITQLELSRQSGLSRQKIRTILDHLVGKFGALESMWHPTSVRDDQTRSYRPAKTAADQPLVESNQGADQPMVASNRGRVEINQGRVDSNQGRVEINHSLRKKEVKESKEVKEGVAHVRDDSRDGGADDATSPFCSKHRDEGKEFGSVDENCHRCKRSRKAVEALESERRDDEVRRKRAQRKAKDACTLCDGVWLLDVEPLKRCYHLAVTA